MNMAREIALRLLLIGSAHADDWGTISGQIVVEGDVPDPVLLFAKDDDIKDKEVCATKDHYAEVLIVDPQTKGLANVFIYLAKKPKLIHPDLGSLEGDFKITVAAGEPVELPVMKIDIARLKKSDPVK